MRTVLYSTLTKNRTHAFQGVAKLVTHEHPAGGVAQHIGYLGEKTGSSIRNAKPIPCAISRTKPGTDVIILGYNAEDSWESDLIFSVLENFWPAIHFGDLEVEVNEKKINSRNLEKLLTEYSTDSEFDAHRVLPSLHRRCRKEVRGLVADSEARAGSPDCRRAGSAQESGNGEKDRHGDFP